MDKNVDGAISLSEFMDYTNSMEFVKPTNEYHMIDEMIDSGEIYTSDELQRYKLQVQYLLIYSYAVFSRVAWAIRGSKIQKPRIFAQILRFFYILKNPILGSSTRGRIESKIGCFKTGSY